jgi:NAD(P)-dependent dehydrogenase (short-subunit alcohol dehydrogenase family)
MDHRRPLALVTGANSGVGFEASRILAASGWSVVMACRAPDRGERARSELVRETGSEALHLEIADLARLPQVEALAERTVERWGRLDGLVLNAGLYAPRLRSTEGGHELTLGVNHLAHVLLTHRLLKTLAASGGRVVSVTSQGHRRGDLRRAALPDIFDGTAWRGGLAAYCDSKLANVLFAFELDRRLRGVGVRADAVHPGVLATRIWDRPVREATRER